MTSIPANLTLIREDFQKPRALAEIKASMLAAPTDYVMVVGLNDLVDIPGVLDGGVHYLPVHVTTRRAFRYSRPAIPYDPVLLTQFNYLGMPILHRSLVALFPEAAVEPWHTVMVRAQSQGASFSLLEGSHIIVEPWPRPIFSGAYSRFLPSFDPDAVMAAVPTVLVDEIDQLPYYTLRDPRAEAFRIFCRNCTDEFISSLSASNVVIEVVDTFDYARILDSKGNYVTWFDSIGDAVGTKLLSQLQVGLEFPGVKVISPRVFDDYTLQNYVLKPSGIVQGFDSTAWAARIRDLDPTPPSSGYLNTQAILRRIS